MLTFYSSSYKREGIFKIYIYILFPRPAVQYLIIIENLIIIFSKEKLGESRVKLHKLNVTETK